ncbi:hypothetical protein CEXT_537191 [Caerostris extrusa]|uniref:Uncharacterized protein n=1 Tax=Caerostris extrusa TaxID=172846 RepID=A0AAV4Y4X2_CAEEX|nr:hypothetical protein CEXT_537191 [Caerostris extrusa]
MSVYHLHTSCPSRDQLTIYIVLLDYLPNNRLEICSGLVGTEPLSESVLLRHETGFIAHQKNFLWTRFLTSVTHSEEKTDLFFEVRWRLSYRDRLAHLVLLSGHHLSMHQVGVWFDHCCSGRFEYKWRGTNIEQILLLKYQQAARHLVNCMSCFDIAFCARLLDAIYSEMMNHSMQDIVKRRFCSHPSKFEQILRL